MDNTARALDREVAQAPVLTLEPPEPDQRKERHFSIEAEAPRYNGATSVTLHADGGALVSRYTDGVSVMLHFSAGEWSEFMKQAQSQEGT